MIVGDPGTAAEVVTSAKRRLYFDDIGCMIAFVREESAPPRHVWVHATSGWVDAVQARYQADARTPMDYGWITAGSSGVSFEEMRADVVARIEKEQTP
jgi:hypothetical protein